VAEGLETRPPFDPAEEASTAEQLQHVAQRNRILAMARRGATPGQISEVLAKGDDQRGIAPVAVEPERIKGLIRDYLESARKHDALTVDQLRVMEMERLDQLQQALETELRFTDPETGQQHINLKVADRLLRLSERRAKMAGLDAPQVMEHRVGEGLKELGLLEEHIHRADEAARHAFADRGLPDPSDVIDVEAVEIPA
jgi:hypothetical protein